MCKKWRSFFFYLIKKWNGRLTGWRSVGRVVASNTRDPWFESNHCEINLLLSTVLKDENNEKEAGTGTFPCEWKIVLDQFKMPKWVQRLKGEYLVSFFTIFLFYSFEQFGISPTRKELVKLNYLLGVFWRER